MSGAARSVIRGCLFVAVGSLVLLALAHAPPIQSRVARWAFGYARRLGVVVAAERVGYNLLTLHVHAEGMSVALDTLPRQPFAQARGVDVVLPWSALWSGLSIDLIRLDEPRVTLTRNKDGSTNWPSGRSTAGTSSPPLPIRSIAARDLAFTWRDETIDAGVDVRRVDIDLQPTPRGAAGRLRVAEPGRIVWRGRDATADVRAEVAWDGRRLEVDAISLDAGGAALRAKGTIGLLGPSQQIALDYDGRVGLGATIPWLLDGIPPAGTLLFRGRATGPIASLRTEMTVTGSELTWRGVAVSSLDATLSADARGVEVDRVSLRVAGGALDARGRVALDGEDATNRLSASWRDIDTGLLLPAFGVTSPAMPSGEADGRATASWTAWKSGALTLSLTAALRPSRSSPRRLGLRGAVSLGARGGRWQATIDQQVDEAVHVEGQVGGLLSDASFGRSTLGGRVAATVDAPQRLWRVLEKLSVTSGDPPSALTGTARADLVLSGTVEEPFTDAQIAGADLRFGPIGPVALGGRLRASRHEATLDEVEVRLGQNTLRGNLAASFDRDRLNGAVDARLAAIEELLRDARPSLAVSGTAQVSATTSGRLSSPLIEGRVSGQSLGLAGQRADRLAADFRFARQILEVDKLELTQTPTEGRLDGNGWYNVRARTFAGSVSARNVVIAPILGGDGATLAPLGARADAELSVHGSIDDPLGRGRVDLQELRWEARQLGRASGDLTLADRQLSSVVELPDLFTTGTASLVFDPLGAFVVDLQVADGDLAALASRLAIPTEAPLTGTTTLVAHADGRVDRLTESRLTLQLQRLDAHLGDIPVRVTRAGRATYDEGGLAVGDLTFDVGRAEVRVAGRVGRESGGTLEASVDGTLADLANVAMSFWPARPAIKPELDGRVSIAARVTGTIEHPAIDATARLDDGRVAFEGVPPATGIVLRASYRDGLADVSQVSASWQGATLRAEGRAPLSLFAQYLPAWLLRTAPVVQSNGHLSARFEALTPAMLAPWVAATTLSQVSGQSSGTLTLEADAPTIAGVRAELVLDRAELSVAGVRFDAGRPARFDLTDGWLQIVDWEWGGEGHELSLGGGAQLDDGPTLDLWADGLIDLRVLGAFLPRVSTAGRALLSAQVTGTARAPQFAGHIDLQRGDIRLADPQIIVSDLDGRLLFARDELTIADLRGSANGGTLSVTGRVGYAGLQPTDGRLSVQGRGMALSLPDPLKTEADANLSLGIERGALSLAGEVTVLRGSYRQPLSIAGGLLQVLQQLEASVEDEDPSMIDTMALDVRIATAEDIMVDNNYARLALGADLRLRGTVARPVLAGRAEAREGGRIFLGGNVYQLVGNGAIDFADPSRIVPDLNITAEARVSGYEVTLTLKGTPIRLETTLSSYPPLGQADIVSLLVTGRVQADSRPLPTIGREQMLAYLSGEVFGVAGRAVGLDTLRIEPGGSVRFDAGLIATETNPGSRLTFGKQVTRDVDVVFSHNLKENGNFTWIVAYRPRSNVEVRIVSDDSNDRLYGFRHDVTVGGLTVSPPTGRLAPPRVGAVRLVGDSEKLGPGLRGRLSLTAGRSFDFFRWQQDRDKLERFCRDAGYLEARIVARRLPLASAAASRVDLEYDVQLGRRTIVDISGLPRSTGLRRDVEALWSRSVFDAFLTDEATKTARSRLIGEGYLRATVAASIESLDAAREKHLVLRIDRGPRSDRWRLALSGNVAVGSDRLLALARARGLEKAAWMDAEPLERALTALYRDEGFLSATVATHAPVFEGREATLPVTIDEGPMFRVDRVEFAGAESQGVEELRAAFGLRPGAVFTRASSAEAARALGDFYRGRGFSNANVAVTSRTNRSAGTVTLAVEVNEGSRQVLRDLVVEGRHRTSATLVSRELRLNVGEPVDPSRWAQARKRLYDTGVFRQVDLEAQPVSAEPDGQLSAVEQPVRAHVTLEEWPPLRLRYGLEVDDSLAPASAGRRLRPGVAGDLTYRGLFGRAASAGLAARFANDFRAARSFVTARSFLGRSLTSNLFLARSRETIGSSARPIVTEKSEFTFEQLFRERRPLQLAYGYRFERNHTFNRAARPDDPFAYDLTVNVARLTATGLIDTRDDLVDATRGHFFSSTFEYGASVLGSDIRFAKQFIQESYFRSLGRRLVFATSGRLGLAAGFGQDLIPSEQFFAGGGNSVRGYGEATLGPRDLFGGATGGNALLILNEELRFPIAWRLRGVLFLDGGNAFATIGQLTPADLRTGVGLGVRVQTPFALLRVDLGTPLDRRAGESRVRWFVSIGQIF